VTSVVLDASAVLAIVNAEPGADVVRASLAGAIMSTVNYSEVLKKTVEHGGTSEAAAAFVRGLSITLIPFDEALAAMTADLYPQAKQHGLSLADRACLALGIQRGATVLTADGKWKRLSLSSIKVKLIRNAH
jgi:ribonuclease VapC